MAQERTMESREAKMLSDILIAPASLRNFVTLQQFIDIFPKGRRSDPAVRELYRELTAIRGRDIETVRQDIAREVKRSKQLKRDCAQQRRHADETTGVGLDPVALHMEQELSGIRGRIPKTVQPATASIDEACESLESQIAGLERENQDGLLEIREAIDALTDLRRGRLPPMASGGDISTEVLATLKRLEAVCTNSAG